MGVVQDIFAVFLLRWERDVCVLSGQGIRRKVADKDPEEAREEPFWHGLGPESLCTVHMTWKVGSMQQMFFELQ